MGACIGFPGGTPRRPRSSWETPVSLRARRALAGPAITTRTESLAVVPAAFRHHHPVGDHPGRLVPRPPASARLPGWRPCSTTFETPRLAGGHDRHRFWIIAGLFVAARPRHLLCRVGGRGRRMTSRVTSRAHHREADWAGLHVLVAGLGINGIAAADTPPIGARASSWWMVRISSSGLRPGSERILDVPDVEVRTGPEATSDLPDDREVDLVITSPGGGRTNRCWSRRPGAAPVWGEVELAWRMRLPRARPLADDHGHQRQDHDGADVRLDPAAAGLRATSAGNVGMPILDAVMDPSPRRHRRRTLQLPATALVGVTFAVRVRLPQHRPRPHPTGTALSRTTGRPRPRSTPAPRSPASTTSRILRPSAHGRGGRGRRGRARDRRHDRGPGAPRCSVPSTTCSPTAPSWRTGACNAAEARHAAISPGMDRLVPPHVVANALAAAALARACGVPPSRSAMDSARPFLEPHRVATVATVGGVRFWSTTRRRPIRMPRRHPCGPFRARRGIAGGYGGADIDPLVAEIAARLRGRPPRADRAAIAESLARHAPDVPVVTCPTPTLVRWTSSCVRQPTLARPGDVVLLAPGRRVHGHVRQPRARGDAFAEAVRALPPSGSDLVSTTALCHPRAPPGGASSPACASSWTVRRRRITRAVGDRALVHRALSWCCPRR